MSPYSKNISVLNQKNDSLKKELSSVETQLGFLYLDDAACPEESVSRYNELKTEFQHLMGTLTEIKNLETKKKDLSADIQNMKTEIAGLVAKESSLMMTLGIALYGQSNAASVPSFSKAYEEATGFAEKITALKTQAEQMTESLELQNVFSRVVTKVKINSISMSINSQQKKLDAALVAGAKAVVEAQDLDETLKCPAYETCLSFRNEWNKARINLEALQDELQNVDVTLADYGKKLLVQEKADAKNSEIDAFAFQVGHSFDKKYITRDGEKLTDFPEQYSEGLSRVLSLRGELASVNRRLDILHYSEQIDAACHAREIMEKEVLANNEKIKKIQSHNAELQLRMDENTALTDELRAHREAVEKEEGISIEDLLSKPEEAASEKVPAPSKTEKKTAPKKTYARKGKKAVTVISADDTDAGAGNDELSEEAEFLKAYNDAKASAEASGQTEVSE